MKRFSIFLITVVLIAGTAGCALAQYNLTISSTEGGSVTTPGGGTFARYAGRVVDLVDTPNAGYQSVNRTGDVGIKAGDWIKFEYTYTGLPAGQSYIEWSRLEFLSVEGTNATVWSTMHGSDGSEQYDTVSVDVVSDGGVLGFSRGIISANLTTGDSFNITGYGYVLNVTIEGETTKTYAGVKRTVVYASFLRDEAQLTYYWDKLTGVVVESSLTDSGVTAIIKATETNMWGTTTVEMPWWPWIIVAVAVVGLVVLLVLKKGRGPADT